MERNVEVGVCGLEDRGVGVLLGGRVVKETDTQRNGKTSDRCAFALLLPYLDPGAGPHSLVTDVIPQVRPETTERVSKRRGTGGCGVWNRVDQHEMETDRGKQVTREQLYGVESTGAVVLHLKVRESYSDGRPVGFGGRNLDVPVEVLHTQTHAAKLDQPTANHPKACSKPRHPCSRGE